MNCVYHNKNTILQPTTTTITTTTTTIRHDDNTEITTPTTKDPEVDYRKEFEFLDFHYHIFRQSRGFPRSSSTAEESRRAWYGAPQPIKTIRCNDIQWSVISTDFSPDEKWLAYSSWSPYVHLCNTRG